MNPSQSTQLEWWVKADGAAQIFVLPGMDSPSMGHRRCAQAIVKCCKVNQSTICTQKQRFMKDGSRVLSMTASEYDQNPTRTRPELTIVAQAVQPPTPSGQNQWGCPSMAETKVSSFVAER